MRQEWYLFCLFYGYINLDCHWSRRKTKRCMRETKGIEFNWIEDVATRFNSEEKWTPKQQQKFEFSQQSRDPRSQHSILHRVEIQSVNYLNVDNIQIPHAIHNWRAQNKTPKTPKTPLRYDHNTQHYFLLLLLHKVIITHFYVNFERMVQWALRFVKHISRWTSNLVAFFW